ncbi:LuxR C-terminal-related transcriptional regulator [Micromonospora sp. NPDC049559]|uniref:helix-turn-helix transcriptional regulator n=1 Tax=Micromonospora sp. NPDC049559 TaxID=3155923 RepID=UPI00341D6482
MMLRTAVETPLVLDEPTRALLDSVAADPLAPRGVGIQAPGGHGKSALLQELARVYRRAGATVLEGSPEPGDEVDPDAVLLVDDAHLLDDARLRELRRLAETRRCRLFVAYRPWPRPAGLVELAELFKRDGRPLLLCPFTREQTATLLAGVTDLGDPARLAEFVQQQTNGVPRDVDRLVRALRAGPNGAPGRQPLEVPQSVVLQFGSDLEDLDPDVRRLLLAAATGVELPVDLLGALLGQSPEAVDELLSAAKATGLLGPDDRLAPIARRAVAALSPATQRSGVWQRVAELQRQRGGPVLPLVRSLLAAGIAGGAPAETFELAAEEALPDDPALAAELFAASAAAGRPAAARQALAAALAGDLDSALRLADRLVAAPAPADRADGATVAATALAHRGHLGRSAELYRWSGTASSLAFAVIAAIGVGQPDALELPDGSAGGGPGAGAPPTMLASTALLMARGVRETLTGVPTAALSALVQASALLEPAGRAVLLPDSPAALAALTALHCGELEIGERVLERAIAARLGAPLMSRRHLLLQAWILMVRGRTGAAAESLAKATAGSRPLESRDLLFATALEMGIARRNSDLPALQRGWGHALEAIVRHPVDLFTLLPLGEFAIAAARLGDLNRLGPYLREAQLLLDRLGQPALWATPLHWSGLHAAILAEEPTVADQHVAALTAAAGHSRYAAVVAAAAESWVEVLRGVVDPVRVEAAARGLHAAGLYWDGARLAGQAAIRTSDRRAMTTLLDCARVLQGRPAGHKGAPPTGETGTGQVADAIAAPSESRLSEREQEVAELVLAGLTYKQIGDRLFISAKTVEHHVARMRSRLNCANRSELLARLRVIVADRSSGEPVRPPWPKRPAP